MACDRPLAHLEDSSGPAVAGNFLPARPGVDARRMGNAKLDEGRGRSGPTRADSPERDHAGMPSDNSISLRMAPCLVMLGHVPPSEIVGEGCFFVMEPQYTVCFQVISNMEVSSSQFATICFSLSRPEVSKKQVLPSSYCHDRDVMMVHVQACQMMGAACKACRLKGMLCQANQSQVKSLDRSCQKEVGEAKAPMKTPTIHAQALPALEASAFDPEP